MSARRSVKVAIIGFGLEGRSLFFYLKRNPRRARGGRDFEITILDKNPEVRIPRGARAVLGKNYLDGLNGFDLIFRSPGVPYNLPGLKGVRKKLLSLTRLFFERAQGAIVGVTGSAGKTTTATLLYKMLKRAGRDAYLVGNIGVNSLSVLDKLSPRSVTVIELSSFQLQDLSKSPRLAIVLDVYEEHLDKHGSFREYLASKANLVRFQRKKDAVLYAAENRFSKKLAMFSPGTKIGVWPKDAAGIKTRLLGEHNLKNVAAAAAAARLLGAPEPAIRRAAADFRPIADRLEFVRDIRGVKFYNDSKATNIGSAVAGVDSFREPKIVLSGGYGKNLSFKPLARRLARPDVRLSILFGKARGDIARELRKAGRGRFKTAPSLKEAVKLAWREARSGEVVLLAPATASFDEFKNYRERGRAFKRMIKNLKT